METSTQTRLQVRVVQTKEHTWPGWVVGICGGLGLLGCVYLADEFKYVLVGVTLAIWGAGPMLAWRPRSLLRVATRTAAGLQVGTLTVPWGATAQIANGRRGASVALGFGRGEGAFFEVASMQDARTLVSMAQADETRPVALRVRFDTLRRVTAVLGFIAMSCGLGYAVVVGLLHDSGGKGTYGLSGLCFAVAASFLYLIAQLARRNVVVGMPGSAEGATGAVRTHLTLHVEAAQGIVQPHARGVDANDGTPPRVRIMLREDEPTRTWLARIDGAAGGGEGYRGFSASREELSSVLTDRTARPDLRLAAARVLVRRHGESTESVTASLDTQLEKYGRVVALEDADRAAEELDRLGPIFIR
jgi:hypothetical protein